MPNGILLLESELDIVSPAPRIAPPLRWLLQTLVFVVFSVPAFFVGWYAALLPCLFLDLGMYCSAHGGPGQILGLALGVILALKIGLKCARLIAKA